MIGGWVLSTSEANYATFVATLASFKTGGGMASQLADLLFKKYRRRILSLLLTHPDESWHVREIARLTDTLPGTLHKELSRLAKAGLLIKFTRGNQVNYQANQQCVIFEELASILRKTSGAADVIADALLPFREAIELAFIFGSYAKGTATERSDIDLLVVGELSYSEMVKALYPAQERLGLEINPKLYTCDEWAEAVDKNTPFVRDVLSKPITKIIGDKDDSGKSGRNQSGTNRA